LSERPIAWGPLAVPSLKEACVHRLEELILSGELQAGQRLPSERDLAAQLAVSRPVLHQALVELAAKGLVEILPRKGVYVNDFRTQGSCALLSSLLAYHEGALAPDLIQGLLAMRLLLEAETARLAALQRSPAQLQQLEALLAAEAQADRQDATALVELDFALHLQVALASGNTLYALIMNSIKGVYTNLTRRFFTRYRASPVVDEVFDFHRRLVAALTAQESAAASAIMVEMLEHGARHLQEVSNG